MHYFSRHRENLIFQDTAFLNFRPIFKTLRWVVLSCGTQLSALSCYETKKNNINHSFKSKSNKYTQSYILPAPTSTTRDITNYFPYFRCIKWIKNVKRKGEWRGAKWNEQGKVCDFCELNRENGIGTVACGQLQLVGHYILMPNNSLWWTMSEVRWKAAGDESSRCFDSF